MPTLTIDIPKEKVQLIVDAVNAHLLRQNVSDSYIELTPAEVEVWVKDWIIKSITRFVKHYQRDQHESSFVFDDPMAP